MRTHLRIRNAKPLAAVLASLVLILSVLLNFGSALIKAAAQPPVKGPTATTKAGPPFLTPLVPQLLPQPVAAFDWSMPTRFGLDENGDRLVDYFLTRESISPSSWRVEFDACASTGPIALYRWNVNGWDVAESSSCSGFWQPFAREGTYQVTLTVVGTLGPEASVTHAVVVQDWLIVGMGDSYASGEGAPDVSIDDKVGAQRAEQAAALAAAQGTLDDSLRSLADLRVRLTETENQAAVARQAAGNWYRWCILPLSDDWLPMPDLECAAATATLAQELTELGITAVSEVIDRGLQFISDKIDQAVQAVRDEVTLTETRVAYWEGEVQRISRQFEVDWQDKQCHRSAWAGQAQAAWEIESRDPRTSVTFVHVACGGATINQGIIGPYEGTDNTAGGMLPPQIDQVRALVGEREIDAMLISIGGNDVYFGPMAVACMLQTNCTEPTAAFDDVAAALARAVVCSPQGVWSPEDQRRCEEGFDQEALLFTRQSAAEMFDEGIRLLPARYADLAGRLQADLPDLPPRRVYLNEYPNPLMDDNGSLCPGGSGSPSVMLFGVDAPEIEWMNRRVVPSLNSHVWSNGGSYNWNIVGGIVDAFRTHGYCADQHWLNRLQESVLSQGWIDGTIHPNRQGYAAMARRIASALAADLYPTGDLTDPRRPKQPPMLYGYQRIGAGLIR